MRWFWTFIALLALLTLGLYTTRVRRAHAAQLALAQAIAQEDAGSQRPARRSRRDRAQPESETQPQPQLQTQTQSIQPDEQPSAEPTANKAPDLAQDDGAPTEPEILAQGDEPESESQPEPELESPPETLAQAQDAQLDDNQSEPEPQGDEQLASDSPAAAEPQGDIVIDILPPEPEPEPEPQEAEAAADKPDYELLPGGGFRLPDRDIQVTGNGTADSPYVLSWDLLKSVQQGYNPKEGQTDLPQWLGLLEGKQIRIEGNTLVPVIATTTRELLVMQNPWDGCCIGVPPTPYDAVEVILNHDVDFGNSALGFGTVEGDFYLDPYVVDGWVLGLYIIEDAKYRSGDGIVFPQF